MRCHCRAKVGAGFPVHTPSLVVSTSPTVGVPEIAGSPVLTGAVAAATAVTVSTRYWSEASKERSDPSGIFYYWNGERPRDPKAPQLDGTGEILIETTDRAAGYWITRSSSSPELNARTSGVYLRADPEDVSILDGDDDARRAELIAERLERWKSVASS